LDNLKDIILEFATNNSKSKFYFNDILKAVRKKVESASVKDVKNTASEMVTEGILDFYSTGSTSMYMLKEK
jgi:hypothetical protein